MVTNGGGYIGPAGPYAVNGHTLEVIDETDGRSVSSMSVSRADNDLEEYWGLMLPECLIEWRREPGGVALRNEGGFRGRVLLSVRKRPRGRQRRRSR